jgi:HSP20 family molecular chaperone IbpA
MGTFRVVRNGSPPPRRIALREELHEYSVELDVSDFGQTDLGVDVVGQEVTVRCVHERAPKSSSTLELHERLEETFRLPDDAEAARLRAVWREGTLVLTARRRPLTKHRIVIEGDHLAQPADLAD